MATQFFTSMMERPLPSIAEVDSLLDLLNFGIDGVQLSEETCVGQQGVEVVRFVSELVARKRVKPSKPKPGKVVWIMGLTSSGKTTIAYSLAARLSYSKVPVTILDGDEARTIFGPNFSFEAKNRLQVIKSIVHHAKKAVSKGDNVIVSALTAGDESRKFIKDEIENLTIIYLDCPIEECIIRDEKGLYAKAINGKIDTIAGINFEYSVPNSPHLVLNTLDLSVDECVGELLGFLISNNRINLWGNLSL